MSPFEMMIYGWELAWCLCYEDFLLLYSHIRSIVHCWVDKCEIQLVPYSIEEHGHVVIVKLISPAMDDYDHAGMVV